MSGAAGSEPVASVPPHQLLLIFAKEPIPGRVKTRLGREIGMAEAARVYRHMGRAVVDRLRSGPYETVVSFAPSNAQAAMHDWLGSDGLAFWPQVGSGLGARMSNAFRDAFGRAERVCIVGTDVPGLERSHVLDAFALLDRHDAVFGPATDGGYYLLSLRRHVPSLFEGIVWSTPSVLAQSEQRAARCGLDVARISTLADIDTEADLQDSALRNVLRSADVQE